MRYNAMREDVSVRDRLCVQPPVLHIDKHMSMGCSMGFVVEQTRLYIVEAVGQWTTGQLAALLQRRRSSNLDDDGTQHQSSH